MRFPIRKIEEAYEALEEVAGGEEALAQEAESHGRRIGELEDRLERLERALVGQVGLRLE